MLVHLLLAVSLLAPPSKGSPPSKAAAQKAFNDGNWQAALDLYLALAEAPGVHPPNALVGAHDSLRALHDAAPSDAHICRALALAREVLHRDDLSDDERAYWAELAADDAARAGAGCAGEGSPSEPIEVDEAPTTTPAQAQTPEGPVSALATRAPEPRRPTARVVTGSLLSIVGASLVGGTIGVLVRRDRTDEKIAAITTTLLAENRGPTSAESEVASAARASFKEDRTTAWALGIIGSVSLLTGLTLALIPARPSSSARLRANAAGIVYSF
ncbi:hypothetical protein [Nannocystis bainbridge]|uniref:Tetratricopeptide repeat protein n=1 Tax=Nannocystis bainbridge TaxID=2995303 RepID=A0ABT5E4Q6_9BACT|nr:hypothetical protein [Nannocystis bainbridge]MDC0720852.1 hypothetical protein [Nannocystis bainbridge]